MIVAQSTFLRTNRVFENVRGSALTRHQIDLSPASKLVEASSRMFSMLDRNDPAQAEISRRLWVLRSSILFSLLCFDDPALELSSQVSELDALSMRIPETSEPVKALKSSIADIVNIRLNPKREWIIRKLSGGNRKDASRIGLLSALSAGRVPGWPAAGGCLPADLSERIVLIRTRRDLTSQTFDEVILPCSCQTVPSAILFDLMYSGVTTKIDVLLYTGERFLVPQRQPLLTDRLFVGKVQKTRIEIDLDLIPGDQNTSPLDTWMNEAFWHGVHGAQRRSSPDLVPAHYVLFSDGTGTFLPSGGRVVTLPVDGKVIDERDLRVVRIEEVCEEDLIAIRSGDSGLLLDEASDRIMNRSSHEALFESATDWKGALDALLVTMSKYEIVQEMSNRGVLTSPGSIPQWAGPALLGPGDEVTFRELIKLLADKGKIRKSGAELVAYAQSRWNNLEELRGLRQRAGNLIRQDLFKALFSRFQAENHISANRESIHLAGDVSVELLILRVATIDRNTAYVQQSRLGQIEDLKGSKWLA